MFRAVPPGPGLFFAPSLFPPFSAKPIYVPPHRPRGGPLRIPQHPTLIRRMLDARLKKPPGGTPLIVGRALVQTVRPFFPPLNDWLDHLPDTRVQQACTYPTRFLAWWGLLLYLLQLGSRRRAFCFCGSSHQGNSQAEKKLRRTETEARARHQGLTPSTRLIPQMPEKPIPQPCKRANSLVETVQSV